MKKTIFLHGMYLMLIASCMAYCVFLHIETKSLQESMYHVECKQKRYEKFLWRVLWQQYFVASYLRTGDPDHLDNVWAEEQGNERLENPF